jgi:hypothetical protein
MYSACLYCQGNLGRNELLPRFPTGRRIAFDSAKGRLWVICGSCARWNLSPLEERLESIDECERQFRRTRIRVSTPNIGLVELPEGVALIRIGKPLFPEFAAWRYGRRFRRRRVKNSLALGTLVTGAVGATLGAAASGLALAAYWAAYGTALWIVDEGPKRRPVTSFRLGGRVVRLQQHHAEAARVFSSGGNGEFGLALHHSQGVELLRGPDVRHALGYVVPALSPFGGAKADVRNAITLVDQAGSADVCVANTMKSATRYNGWFTQFPVEIRLALEMSLQEEDERRAMEGELRALEQAWREAEQIAAIADGLLVPPDVLERIAGLRKGTRRPGLAFH